MKRLLLALALIFLFTGCWDHQEIERLAFVMGVALDIVPPPEDDPTAIFRLAFEIPIVTQLITGEGQQSDGKRASLIMTTLTSSQAEAIFQIATRLSRTPFLGHQQVLIIGEDTARLGLNQFLDFWSRYPQSQRRLSLFISQGEAKEIFDIHPPLERTLSSHLTYITENEPHITARFPRYTLSQAHSFLMETGSVILPRVTASNSEAKVGGSAVIRDWKLVGWLGEVETRGALWLLGMIDSETIVVELDGNLPRVSVTILRSLPQLEIIDTHPLPTLRWRIRTQGILSSQTGPQVTLTQTLIQEIEDKISQQIVTEISWALDKYREFQSDFLQLETNLRTRYPRIWRRIAEDWDQIFTDLPIEVVVENRIRLLGMVV